MPPEMLTEEERLATIEWYEGTQTPFWNQRVMPWIQEGLALAVQIALDTKRPINERDKACGQVETMNRILALKEGYEQAFSDLKASEAADMRREPEREEELVGAKAEEQWYDAEGRQ